VPEDLALGWGPMSDNHVLAAFDVSQGARFYTWRPRGPLPIAREDVIVHSANTHVIPADARIRSELARLRVGQVVHLAGTLVDAHLADAHGYRRRRLRGDAGRECRGALRCRARAGRPHESACRAALPGRAPAR